MPAFKALLAQVLGLIAVVALVRSGFVPPDRPLGLAVLQGGLAAAASMAVGSDRWWIPIHVAFAPAAVLALRWGAHPGWYLAGFLLLALVFWSSFRTQVPLYLSNRATARALQRLLPENRPLRVLDLGSGTGGLLRALAALRPDCRFTGVENAPLPYWWSRLAARRLGNVELRRGDFWRHSLADYDIVYAFLSPVPMPQLWRKVRREMRPGSLLVSNSFPVPAVEAREVIRVPDRRRTLLYLYRL